ncbi:hypothetical protein ACFWP2_35105 [Kitasatospora sp. NPDC058444]|uniref:hypothetical protein n=1 Tax=Kitasatospora sp. NPDC058444 TaxID=3346504 RepID=UPI003651F74C
MTTSRAYWIDVAERTGATAAEAGLAYAITEANNLSAWWVPVLIPLLAAAKGTCARFVGRKGTASLLPAGADPASRP